MASGDPSHKQQASVSVSTSDTGTATPSNDPKVGTDTVASPAKPSCGVPVDSEGKAKIFRPWSLQRPHHLTFHLVWSAFLTCQFATFSAAALAPVIRENLNATASMMSGAGIAAVTGSMVSRFIMGWMCETLGPRIAMPAFMLLLSPAVFCMVFVTSGAGLIVVRFFIGLSLGGFVTTQFCSSQMFNVRIVGGTNATAAGWGNMGGGLAQLFMPLIYLAIKNSVPGWDAWRWSFFIPGGLMVLTSILFMLFAQDSPAGNLREVQDRAAAEGRQLAKKESKAAVAKYALRNYRTWMLAVSYAFSFGVELTVNNIIVGYISDQFGKDLITAGGVGSLFGLMNLFSRTAGGLASDYVARDFGMRGRLWLLFGTQVLSGVFCIVLGRLNSNFEGSVALLVLFALAAQMSEGANFSIVPFVSKRALGVVAGTVGAMGSFGAVILQFAFFFRSKLTYYDGITWMGVLVAGVGATTVPLIHFPMWGGMLRGPVEGAEEAGYYISEYTVEEVAAGMATASMRFAVESKSQRGRRTPVGGSQGGVSGGAPGTGSDEKRANKV